MTTENIRIAGYIVPDVYDRFEEFCQENQLNCSKALNVILAEYLGVETKIVEQTWIGGVTLPEFEKLKKEVEELKELGSNLAFFILRKEQSCGHWTRREGIPIPTTTVSVSWLLLRRRSC